MFDGVGESKVVVAEAEIKIKPDCPFWLILILLAGCATHSSFESETGRDGIRKVVGEHMADVRHCYEAALDEEPMLEGKLVLSWEIDQMGHALNVTVQQADPKIARVSPCVIEKLKTWQFTQPDGDELVSVSYPFFFSENGQFKAAPK